MTKAECQACHDTLMVSLPVGGPSGDFIDRECPCCKPWPEGFGGLYHRTTRGVVLVIAPAMAGQPATYINTRGETHVSN